VEGGEVVNEREQELSKAIDALTELRYLLHGIQPIAPTSRIVRLADEALGHVEAAVDMPKPSKIRDLFQRLGRAA
jgi:hypothetical protein